MADDDINDAWEYIIDAAVISAYAISSMNSNSGAYLESEAVAETIQRVFLSDYADARLVNALIERFISMGLIDKINDRFVSDYYRFNEELVNYRNARSKDFTTPLGKREKIGNEFMVRAIKNIFDEFSVEDLLQGGSRDVSKNVVDSGNRMAPAADGFVSRDHNSEPYKQAVGAVSAAIKAVSGDNKYGQRDNEDRDQRVAELKAGAELLKSNRIEVSKIEAVLIKTLAYLTGIGVAVAECAAAIQAVKALLGL